MPHFAPAAAALVLVSARTWAQPCAATIVGAESGPYSYLDQGTPSVNVSPVVSDVLQWEDGSGPSVFVAGGLWFRTGGMPFTWSGGSTRFPLARLQNGRWTPIPGPTSVTFANAIVSADLSSVGGPGRSVYAALGPYTLSAGIKRWTGSSWADTAPGPNWNLVSHVDEQGPLLLSTSEGSSGTVLEWRGGEHWSQYAPFRSNFGRVSRLRVLNEGDGPTVFACGSFRDNGRNLRHLMKHVDGQWVQCDLPPSALTLAAGVTDLAYHDDGTGHGRELYLAWFESSGQSHVSRHRAGQWEQLGPSVGVYTGYVDGASLFTIEGDDGPQLFHGGAANLRLWNGTGWTAQPIPVSYEGTAGARVWALERADDGDGLQTFVGGDFTHLLGTPNHWLQHTNAHGLVLSSPEGWTWPAKGLGTPDDRSSQSGRILLVPAPLPQGDRLLAVGTVYRAGGLFTDGLAMFDGQNWQSFGATDRFRMVTAATVAPMNGQARIVAARPHATVSTISAVESWNGAGWNPLPDAPGRVSELATFHEQLFASTPNSTYRLDGAAWVPVAPAASGPFVIGDLGAGTRMYIPRGLQIFEYDGSSITQFPNLPRAVAAMAIHDDGLGPKLYAVVPGAPVAVVRFDDGAWQPVPGAPPVTTDPRAPGCSLASFDDGSGPALYYVGHNGSIDAYSVIAKYAANQWQPVGVRSTTSWQAAPHISLTVVGNRLYIGGQFSQLGTTRADHFAYIERCPPRTCSPDFDGDGSPATDADIEAFFLCLAGTCCPRCTADFNNDGDSGTDADIEAFFRVLAGGPC
jgi:hypothetical protein